MSCQAGEDGVSHFRWAIRTGRKIYHDMGFEPLSAKVSRSIISLAQKALNPRVRQSTAAHWWLLDVVRFQGTVFWRQRQAAGMMANPQKDPAKGLWSHAPHYTRPSQWDDIQEMMMGEWDKQDTTTWTK